MEKKKNIITIKVSETQKIAIDLDSLEKNASPSPKLEEAKFVISQLQKQKEKRQGKTFRG